MHCLNNHIISNPAPHWHVLITRCHHCKRVNDRLLAQGIEAYLPLRKTIRKWSDRKKLIEEPLFGNYMFVRIGERDQFEVLKTDGVARFVYHCGVPAKVRDSEILAVKMFLKQDPDPVIVNYVKEGEMVQIRRGLLKGICGVLENYKNRSRVLISVVSINQSLVVELDANDIAPVAKSTYSSGVIERF